MKVSKWWAIVGASAMGLAGNACAQPASTVRASTVQASTPPASSSPAGPSFSCAAARTSVEQAICSDAKLAAADRDMAALFALARTSAFGTGPSNQLPAQRKALKDMRSCGEPTQAKRLKDCLGAVYAQRNGELAVAVLATSPDIALATLRRTDPAATPLFEALALWTAQPVDADWSTPKRAPIKARVARLLGPYLHDLQTKDEQSFGLSILSDPGTDGVAVLDMDDVFKSDRHFAAFLNVLGPYLPEASSAAISVDPRRTLPCAAIVRHPALLGATTSLYGSTMDNFVLDNDCDRALPPTPALSVLDERLMRTWPQCDGTIRFAAYRGYQTAIDEARLGRTKPDPQASLPERRGISAAQIAAADAELRAYYAKYLARPAPVAATMAKAALAAVLSSAHECGG